MMRSGRDIPTDQRLGGIIHTYQAFDPKSFPPPTAPPPDLVSGAFEHMLAFGSTRQLTDEELVTTDSKGKDETLKRKK